MSEDFSGGDIALHTEEKLQDAVAKARDQAIKECAGQLRVLHRLTGETANYCAEDGFTWPCRTERLLRGLSTPSEATDD